MVSTEEGEIKMADGKGLYSITYKPDGPPTAALLFIHGFSDHAGRYVPFFTDLAQAGILVYAFDQRGWGRSVTKPAEKGASGSTVQVMADIAAVVKARHAELAAAFPGAPLFVMGHSMGGQETLYFLSRGDAAANRLARAYLVSAPYIALHPHSQPGRAKVIVGRVLSRALPHKQLVNQLDPATMSHDAAANADWAADPLCHDTGTLEGLAGMLDRAAALDAGECPLPDAAEWKRDGGEGELALGLFHGTADPCIDIHGTERYVDREKERGKVTDIEFKKYEGAYHCLNVEPDFKVEFTRDVVSFIQSHTQPAPVQAKL